ncbi:hypothetical protein scyTo_0009727 [Scyliorhinus torazame]|uniref:Uncharacterized protein n=1 Tax=Scyliorhinus torazame TaxID=75743 RepID=A0A401NSM7_SCYTO|nr:hypothetical protein [Scyliorhinus torazame]
MVPGVSAASPSVRSNLSAETFRKIFASRRQRGRGGEEQPASWFIRSGATERGDRDTSTFLMQSGLSKY